ncbi:hypothetical protein GJ744_007586 [Endocarpon pusillum]|uniref:Uncharacterized protein n=1 Tax=Endocarpon pusillum TaxID=364733 RepID=A0A8H7AIH8_9EURO|nr:hypothetical protein GJ744_007586 [Endocarpon pusillum]
MSAPSRQFGKLSIDTQMPTTRGQAQGRSAEKPSKPGTAASSSDDDSSEDEQGQPSSRSQPRTQGSLAKGKQRARSESSSSSTDTSTSPIMSRAYRTRDILSTFEADVLPSEFRPDIFETISHVRSPAECMIQLDLEGTIFRLAVNDHAIYRSLSRAQPVQARAVDFFQKVTKRVRITLLAFDEYAKNGTSSAHLPVPHPSVKDLGGRLQEYVDLIKDEVRERHPHGGERAAECLIFLLREVCNRNHDAFENSTWGRRAPRGEDEDERNLFQCLIGHPSVGRPPFALDALRILPKAVLATASRLEQLDGIRGLLHRQQAPLAYRRAFQGILDSITEATSPTAAPQPGQKRPAAGAGRGGQKRSK